MNRITRQECEFPDVIMALPHRKGRQQREQNRETARVLQFILSDDTVHYRMDNMTAVKMIEDDGPPIQPNRREIRWPHDGPFYIEFHQPIILDPTGEKKKGEPGDYLNGLIVLPNRQTTTILTVGTSRARFLLMEHVINHRTGTLTIQDNIPDNVAEEERQRAHRFYHRLADHMAE